MIVLRPLQLLIRAAVSAAFFATLPAARLHAADTVDFGRDIQPILAEHCFRCHGPDDQSRKSQLRLDARDAALKGGKSEKPAIVPGQPQASEMIARLTSADPDHRMPPVNEKKPVKSEDVEKIRRWIAGGAAYASHWAFVGPVKSPLPTMAQKGSESPVDAFVQARLETEGLSMAPVAPPRTLCRRIYLDLVGLLPTLAQMDALEKDAKEHGLDAATDSLVSKLLQSPHFGERWARPWLDAAR